MATTEHLKLSRPRSPVLATGSCRSATRSAGTMPRHAELPEKPGDSAPNNCCRTTEWIPSAPTTTSAVALDPSARYSAVHTEILAEGQAQGSVRDDIPADVRPPAQRHGRGWMMMLPIESKRFATKRVQTLLDATMALIAPLATTKGQPDGGSGP
jgi:hypothetical protein